MFTNFDVHDGLQGDQFVIASSSRGPDGELFFGGSDGVNYFRPEHVTSNTYMAPVVFTEFQLFNQTVPNSSTILPNPVERTKEIILQYDQSVFTIKFAALSYQLSAKNLYQYKMEGFDQDWSPPRTKRDVTYTSLAPGTYTFLVRAANNDGVWNEQPASIVIIKILPPWWETWWFRLLAGLSVVGVVFYGIQLRINQVNRLNKELEKRVAERTSELNAAHADLSQANGRLQSQLEAITTLEKNVRELAVHDALTGLYNRHYLADRLEAEYSRARREQHPIAYLLVDIDHFKLVNDHYGHQAGDRILQAVAQVILGQIRRSDIACRYGGEEFLIVMPEVKAADALQRAETFRKSIEDLRVEEGDRIIQITVSIGVAIYPVHGATNDQMLGSVDLALYEAKDSGRNRVVLCK